MSDVVEAQKFCVRRDLPVPQYRPPVPRRST